MTHHHLSLWGAFSAEVHDGRVVGVEPFGEDPTPSPLLASIPDAVHSLLVEATPPAPRD